MPHHSGAFGGQSPPIRAILPTTMAKMERVIRVFQTFEEAESEDLREWLRLSGDERLAIGEQMRGEDFKTDERGFRRVLRVAERQLS